MDIDFNRWTDKTNEMQYQCWMHRIKRIDEIDLN